MKDSVKITSIIAGTIVLVALIIVIAISQLSPINYQNTVSTTGMSEINVVPNQISLNFNVETKGATSKEANDKNSEIVDTLLTALIKEGFERADIQTTNFYIYEDIEWTPSGRKSSGYKATHSIVVKMSTAQTDKIGSAIDAGINANATLSYINFELSQELENEYKAEAIKLATQDATTKAEAIADGLGKDLGKLVSVTDSSFNYQPWRAYDYAVGATSMENADGAKVATSIQPSEQKITARVSVVYKI